MFLTEEMGFGWEDVHDIAEQMEHVQSVELFAKMDELRDFPNVATVSINQVGCPTREFLFSL